MQHKFDPNRAVKRGYGSIFFIIILLFGSASLRLISNTQSAFAAEDLTSSGQGMALAEDVAEPKTKTEGVEKLLEIVMNREKDVEDREIEIERREQEIEIAKEEIKQQLTALENAETQLRATIALANSAAEDDLIRLTSVYENMKPKVAAELFEEMDPEFAAGFLARMKPDIAASIMTGLTSQKAYSISVVLAGRNAKTPTQ
ncbi:MAG: hypothetical protein ABJM43_10915 [Paracoccaceae bacterium]